MALKHQLEKIEEVVEPLRAFYEAGQDGKYYLQVEGMVPKIKLDEFRTNNIELQRKVTEFETKFKDVDVVKYRELLAAQGKTPTEIEAAVQARVAKLNEDHSAIVNDLQTKLSTTTGQLETIMVDGTLKAEAGKAGVLPTAMDDVVLRGRLVYKMKEGKMVAVDGQGNAMYDKDGQSPMAVTTWLKDLKKNAPHLFAGMQGAGGGGNGGRGPNGQVDMSKMTATQKIAAGLGQMGGNGGGSTGE